MHLSLCAPLTAEGPRSRGNGWGALSRSEQALLGEASGTLSRAREACPTERLGKGYRGPRHDGGRARVALWGLTAGRALGAGERAWGLGSTVESEAQGGGKAKKGVARALQSDAGVVVPDRALRRRCFPWGAVRRRCGRREGRGETEGGGTGARSAPGALRAGRAAPPCRAPAAVTSSLRGLGCLFQIGNDFLVHSY